MSKDTKIEWADHTFNPWVGCTKVSPACDRCYAEGWAKRSGMVQWGAHAQRRRTSEANWKQPIKWNAQAQRLGVRHKVFCASLADWADSSVPPAWRRDLGDVIQKTRSLIWLLLTKRIGNARSMLAEMFPDGVPDNVWIGATICNQVEADRDIPKLLAVPAAKRFLSMEPLLGPVDIQASLNRTPLQFGGGASALHWIIVGGESGPCARPMSPDWARSLRDQCRTASVPFLFKQWGEWLPMLGQLEGVAVRGKTTTPDGWAMGLAGKKASGRLLDGQVWDGVPDDFFPKE